MKYLCLGYFDPQKMDALSQAEIDAVMGECQPHLDRLYGSGHLFVDVGLALEGKCLRRVDGKLRATDGPFIETKEIIGSAFIIEAQDMAEAVQIASLHPTTQVAAGGLLGWGIDIRPIHSFGMGEAKAE